MSIKKSFYFFLVILSFQSAFAQSTPAESVLMKQIRNVSDTAKNEYREKEYSRLLKESKKINFPLGILNAGSGLMTVYSREGKNRQVLDLGTELKKTAKNVKDTAGVISQIYGKSALTLFTLGLDDAGLKDLKAAVRYTEDIHNENKRYYYRGTYYENMTAYYNNSKRYGEKKYRDSVLYFYKKSLESNEKVSDNGKGISKKKKHRAIAFINVRIAIFYLEEPTVKGNLDKAEQHLLAASEVYENKEYNIDPAEKTMVVNQFSWLYMEKKEYQKSIQYGNRALAMEKKFPHIYNRVDSYEILASDYLGLGDKEKSKFYMDKYTNLKDSIRFMEKQDADTTMKKMIKETDKEYKENSKKQWIITGILAFVAATVTLILWRRRNKILRRSYEQFIEKLEKKLVIDMNHENSPETMNTSAMFPDKAQTSSDIETKILKQLKFYESSEEFIKKDFTLPMLAAQLNTNSAELSEIIKNNKSLSFGEYLNQVKINYIVRKLYKEPRYREYKISHLTEICGFASPQIFTQTFKKVTGISLSYFIKKLKDEMPPS